MKEEKFEVHYLYKKPDGTQFVSKVNPLIYEASIKVAISLDNLFSKMPNDLKKIKNKLEYENRKYTPIAKFKVTLKS
jgi:hypothetical protein